MVNSKRIALIQVIYHYRWYGDIFYVTYLFYSLDFCYGTSKLEGNSQSEMKRKHSLAPFFSEKAHGSLS